VSPSRAPSRPALLATALALLVVAAACGGEACEGAACGASDGASPDAIRVVDAPSLPGGVDELPAIDPDGYASLLDEVRGTPLVVNFWASWCAPCEEEMPLLADAAREHADGVQFLGVDILDTRDPARAFLARHDVPFPNVFDPAGEVRDAVGSLGQPVTVFYAADGEVVAKVDGQLSPDDLRRHLAAIAA
jgi:cytochrome c biogenesis protein CcmG/thiol:disulfide interchange protein DsbE